MAKVHVFLRESAITYDVAGVPEPSMT